MINLDSKDLRKEILRMAKAGNSVHIGCAFSIVEIISVLCSRFIKTQDLREKNENSDWLLLSKGHGVMAIYAAFYKLGLLKDSHLDGYFSDGSLLHGLSEAKIPGLEISSGSLGHGLPIAVGVAFGKKKMNSAGQVFCIVGDGEMNEGPMWEALLFASQQNLNNLTIIVDANGYQAMGKIKNVIGLEPLTDKFAAFGFQSDTCDGHNIDQLFQALSKKSEKPKALIAHTIKGKGISFMEDNNEWHYLRLNEENYSAAMKELNR